ncbi:pentatricopeptide repeat-containing protein At1g26460, mitochondrial-like [Andrographis paniculata]|uniref:pentatricopeptide repeat-containing protein At1g26460, mitochondrial-like n=1 Tax=Andrographis paniculata TaxID=175694 RepID=UPI0021E915E8|nr:pentatricopeptide repeat-containing protein At1g26460, mitochondrial-like [Andrographis paniculata]XP_051146301.1 pentatricopeptide repeat-containing protein At1g26460, mitochondrial-like [Andrographis paniculata]XP_051146302.1 pentatricopeptide repeat-containing protein At1g26460, mitochondrial-like [Andrographis paniculata]XP_051146303.1 pentatricopeptide repeat-containing protein At1g26460, mitochondrial-like [Andrographis paniculata]
MELAAILLFARLRCCVRRSGFQSVSTFVHHRRGAPPEEPHVRRRHQSLSTTYEANWRRPMAAATPVENVAQIPVSLGFLRLIPTERMRLMARTLDAKGLTDRFAGWMAEQRWADVKQLFEFWIRGTDANGKPNKPDVKVYNYYLQANFLVGASSSELLDFVAQMDGFGVSPNTASFNLVLRAMHQAGETAAAEKLIERMIQIGKDYKEASPDEESYKLIVSLLFSDNRIDSAVNYIDLSMKSGYMLSTNAFIVCVRSCVNNGRLDALLSIMDRFKKMHKSKPFQPPWHVCTYIADVAMQSDKSELAYCAFEFMAKWMAGGETTRPALPSMDEGLVVSALATAGRMYNSKLLDCSWAVLKCSLRQHKAPAPESYLGKIYAHANMGNILKAFSTLHEFEAVYGNSEREDVEGLFSPFYSLNPLVIACTKKGFTTLDAVFEGLYHAHPHIKSIAAVNCIILGCANMWDADRAYRIFNSIDATFGLTPNIDSYNALICAFGKLKKTDDAVKVFDQFVALGVKPNIITYSQLIDAHLIVHDLKAALATINSMIGAGYEPSKEILKKVRRRCIREMDYKSDDQVDSLARKFNIRMGTEVRRDMLFNPQSDKDE